jgi:hypothetical protein
MVMVGAPNGRYGEQLNGLYPGEARQDKRATGRTERAYARHVANDAAYDWIGKTNLVEPVFTASEVADTLAMDHGRDRELGRVGVDLSIFGPWWRSGQAYRDLARAFCVSGILVMLAHVSAVGWTLIWNGTARLMGN